MPDVPPHEAVDPDQQLLDGITSKGYDLSKPHVIGFRIDFGPAAARQAAADLIRAGHPSVRLEMEDAPSVIVSKQMLVTLDSLRSTRAELNDYASGQDAEVINVLIGGRDPGKERAWKKDAAGTADTDEADQLVIDQLFAWDVDLKQTMIFTGGIAFTEEGTARDAAAALMLEGFPEVAVVESDIGPVAEAVMYMAADVRALHKLRRNLAEYAKSQGGAWLGFHASARAPA